MHLTTQQWIMIAWLASAAASTMPPVGEDAPYLVRWAHDLFQAVGANIKQIGQRSPRARRNDLAILPQDFSCSVAESARA